MNASSASAPRHHSNLTTGRERFLAGVVDYALAEGWRTPGDFLRHFGPRTLLEALAGDPELRAKVLVATTRVNERLALRKTSASAAEDLELALESGLTDADKVLSLIPADDRVRHLDAVQLWAFLAEVEFWKTEPTDSRERDRYVRRVTFVLECALHEGVLRLSDVADGIGLKRIATCLPRAELQRVVEHALSRAREGQRLTEEQLLEAVPLHSLMNHVPLAHTWSEVVLGRLARPLQFIRPSSEEAPRARRLPPPPPSRNKGTSKPPRFDPSLLPDSLLELQRGLETSEFSPTSAEERLEDLVAVSADDSEATQIHMDLETRVDTRVDVKAHRDDDGRHQVEAHNALGRVSAALGRIGRLPAPDPDMTLPILLSIESMYAELGEAIDENARYTIVRDAFPNQLHLRVALIALIRLLDPARRSADGTLEQADADLLIRTFLFEERHVHEMATGAANQHADSLPLRPPVGNFS
jgi:hypothetical protein